MDILKYPKNIDENIRFRAKLLAACEKDAELQAYVDELCSRDPVLWIDLFCWTKNLDKDPAIYPFICYDFQEDFIRKIVSAIDGKRDILLEKSREMGASWMVLYVFTHKWKYEDGSDFRVGSRKEEFVDKARVMDTLFEKMRLVIEKMPLWMLPKDYTWRIDSTYMKIHNPQLGNTIIGESANEDFGSGGRSKAVLLDEFSKWDVGIADAAWTATGDVTKCRIPVSTPKGSGNKFAMLANGTNIKIEKVTLPWVLHPIKGKGLYLFDRNGEKIPIKSKEEAVELWDMYREEVIPGMKGGRVRSPWYDAECERREEGEIAQEIDISYLKSGSPFYDLVELLKQKEWEYGVRANPTMEIPNGRYIKANIIEVQHKPKILERPDGWVRIFELPKKNHQYLVAADTAEGLPKGDECAAVLKDKWTLNTCAVIKGRMAPEDFAYKLFMLSKLFNECMAAPENNNHGYTTCRDFEELGGNLYYTRPANQAKHSHTVPKRGWTTDIRSRPEMLSISAENIRCHATELRDPDLISQCKTFVHNDKTGKPEGDGSFLDDCVIANAICDAVIRQYPYKPASSINKYKQVARDMKRVRNGGFSFAPR